MSTYRLLLAALVLSGCHSVQRPPLTHVAYVDLPRFMGDWYVIASIPTFIEKGAHNALESYRLAADGTIETTFTFRAGGFDGKPKRYTPRAFVREHASNAVWVIQFLWPFKADYQITYLNPEYTQTVIGREKRDYLWIMARAPQIPDADYQRIVQWVAEQGYDTSLIRKAPQRWESRPVGPQGRAQ
jgi:apolipoprotein D and lipocalin family protein